MFYQLSSPFMSLSSDRRFRCGAIFGIGFENVIASVIYVIITKSMRALWLVSQLLVIVSVNPPKNRAFSELLYKSNRPQVSMGYLSNRPQVPMIYKLINHAGCWQNTRRICKPRAAGEWFTNSSSVLPTSQVVYQLMTHRDLWSIAFIWKFRRRAIFSWVYRHINPQLIEQS